MSEPKSGDPRAYEQPRTDQPNTAMATEAELHAPARDAYAAFRSRGFRFFAVGGFLQVIGRQMLSVGVGWEVYRRTGSALALGLVGLVSAFPVILLAIPAGHVADRLSRKKVLLLTQAVSAAASAGLAFVSHAAADVRVALRPHPCCRHLPNLRLGRPRPVHGEPRPGEKPGQRHHLELQHLRDGLRHRPRPRRAPPRPLLLLDHLCRRCLLRARLPRLAASHPRRPRPAPGCPAGRGLERPLPRAPLRLEHQDHPRHRHHGSFRRALRRRHRPPADLCGPNPPRRPRRARLAARGALGRRDLHGLTLAHRPPLQRPGLALLCAVAGFGLVTIVFGASRSYLLSLAMLALSGAFDNVSVVVRHTLVQLLTPDAMRGRVSAVNNVFIGSSNELGAFESGVTAGLLGPVVSVVAGGVATILTVGLVGLVWPAGISARPVRFHPARTRRRSAREGMNRHAPTERC